jgi:hypothetical protein
VFLKYYGSFGDFCVGGLCVKGESWSRHVPPGDFIYKPFIEVKSENSDDLVETLFRAEAIGETFSLDFNCYYRDRLYNNTQKFVIFEKKDIKGLVNMLYSLPMYQEAQKGEQDD